MTSAEQAISVEVVYALPERTLRLALSLPEGATVNVALSAARESGALAGLDLERVPVGIFGRLAQRSEALRDGDRVEIYRGPAADAKAARRARLKPRR